MKEFNSFYKVVNNRKYNTWCKYITRLDTYGCGCQHDCSYCYAKSLLSFRGLWDAKNPRVADIKKIHNTISKLPKHSIVKLGGMTDCFQPIEQEHNITYHTIKLLNHYKINYLIVTKSSLVSSDKYLDIYDKDLAHFQITITNTNDIKCIKYEKASLPSSRIKSIEKLYNLGFDVSVRLSPFIYEYIDFDILNNIKCDKILIEFLKVTHWVKKWFDIDYSKYILKHGGHLNLPLDKKIKQVKAVTGFKQVSVGEFVNDHHKYFTEHVNYNKNDCCNLSYIKPTLKQQVQLTLF